MKRSMQDIIAGIVFLSALGVLLVFTLLLQDFSFTAKPAKSIWFESANGLKPGDPVLVLGTRFGRVLEVGFHEDQSLGNLRVEAKLQLERPLTLREGFSINIQETSFLGGRTIAIDPGPLSNEVLPESDVYRGTVTQSAIEALGEAVKENREDIREIVSSLRSTSDKIEKGEGTLGKLIHDAELYDNLKTASEDFKKMASDIDEGKGTLGKLIKDEKLGDDVQKVFDNLSEITGNVKEGKGVLARLINDEKMGQNLDDTIANIREFSDKVNRGEGSLAKFIDDPSFYDTLKETGENLRDITADLRAGKGTLGKLMTDETLYADIQTTFKSINRAIEDAREAAPVATFSSLLFSSF